MSNEIELAPLSHSSRDVARFLEVSYSIYRQDPHWVAPLLMDLKKVFTDANPLFTHAKIQLWVARQGGRDVGRIAGIVDEHYNRLTEGGRTRESVERQSVERGSVNACSHAPRSNAPRSDASAPPAPAAFFGFFECIDDAQVCRRLVSAVEDWARQQGLTRLLGPMNPTTNDECGLLIEGFDSAPVFMMPYNPRYYVKLIEDEGFRKAKDLLAFMIDLARLHESTGPGGHTPMERLNRIAAKVRARNPELSFRPLRRKTLTQDLAKVKEIYNAAWQDNWGFVPMTDAEMDFMAARLKPLLMEGLIWLAEAGTEPVGFLLALPDYNIALKPLEGRLFTPKLLGFLPYLFGWKRPMRTRVLTLGVKERYRSKGIESAMLIEGLKVGCDAGVTESEASWILEDNVMMCRMLEAIGGRVYKRYRLYEKGV